MELMRTIVALTSVNTKENSNSYFLNTPPQGQEPTDNPDIWSSVKIVNFSKVIIGTNDIIKQVSYITLQS